MDLQEENVKLGSCGILIMGNMIGKVGRFTDKESLIIMYNVRRSKFKRLELKSLLRVNASWTIHRASVVNGQLWIFANLSLKDPYNILKINPVCLLCYLDDHEFSPHAISKSISKEYNDKSIVANIPKSLQIHSSLLIVNS